MKYCNGITLNVEEDIQGGNEFKNETIVMDSKRKRVDKLAYGLGWKWACDMSGNGPKNLLTIDPDKRVS